MRARIVFLLAGCLLLSALAACGGDKPTRLYVLSAMPDTPDAAAARGVPIGIGPVTLPKYLDRPQIVTRVQDNSLAQADLDQWGGDLYDNITHVLAANLSSLLKTDRVSLYPWKDRAPIQYQVTLDITRFERDVDGSTVLSVFWSIVDPNDGKVLVMRRSTYRETVKTAAASGSAAAQDTHAYDAIAAAMSRDLEKFSRDVATAIASLRRA
jgi:uncharacterized lipoprotein YmbA